MAHWLEEEEQRHNPGRKAAAREEFINRKRLQVSENYQAIGVAYVGFIDDLYQLASRVNNLPVQSRADFGSIDGKSKDSHLNNHLNIFSSSRRIRKTPLLRFLSFVRGKSFKNIRVAYFSISVKTGMVDVEIKENMLQRTVIKEGKAAPESGKGNHRVEHFLAAVPVEFLTHELALGMIDWLAFKTGSEDNPTLNLIRKYEVS
jgi:hypothetical protein